MKKQPLGNTGLELSILSLGMSSFAKDGRVIEKECRATVEAALERGVNFLDLSCLPEGSTKVLRDVLKTAKVHVAVRVGGPEEKPDYSADAVRKELQRTLEELGLKSADIVFCGDLEFAKVEQVVGETLPALKACCEEGLAKHIGLSSLPMGVFHRVLDRAPAGLVEVVQSHSHYTLQNTGLEEQIPYLLAKGVGLLNGAPLGSGLLAPGGEPKTHPASKEVKERCAEVREYVKERGLNIAELGIHFAVANPYIASTIVGVANIKELGEDIASIERTYDLNVYRHIWEILSPVQNHNYARGLPENADPVVD